MPQSVKRRSLLLRAIVWLVITAALLTVAAVAFEWFQLAFSKPEAQLDWRALRIPALLLLTLCLTILIATALAFYY